MSLQTPPSNDKLQESAQSPSNKIDYTTHHGVCKTEPDMLGAALVHPVSWRLNSYYTPNEHADAFIDNKLECQSLVVHKSWDFMNTISGNYESLGCTSDQDYANLYTRETHEFDSAITHAVKNGTEAKLGVKRVQGSGSIYKSGRKWRAEISNRNSRFYVGSYETYEEAEAGLEKKRQELAAGEVDRTAATRRQPGIHKKRRDLEPVAHVEMVPEEDRATINQSTAIVTYNQDDEKEIRVIRPRGVYQRKNTGKWFSEMRNPLTKRRGSVGSFDTAEEALEARNRKRREFTVLKDAEKKRKQSATTECKVEAIEWVEVASKSWDAECGGARSARVDDTQEPSSSFDNEVINASGQLVGEFSRMDEELRLAESLDDVDGN